MTVYLDGARIMRDLSRVVILAMIMAVVTVVAASTTIATLYNVAFEEGRSRLIDTVQSRARMMEAVARFDQKYSTDFPGGSIAATLAQVREAEGAFAGFGKTGEFTMAHFEVDQIHFVLTHRHNVPDHLHAPAEPNEPVGIGSENLAPSHLGEWLKIPFDGKNAEPMRRALSGKPGTVIGSDYRGVEVLAAYDFVKILNLGVVAKIDLSEIRAPFIQATFVVAAIVVALIAIGTAIFFRLGEPMVRQLRRSENRLRQIIGKAPIPMIIVHSDGHISQANAKFTETLGWTLEEIPTMDAWWKAAYPDPANRKEARDTWERMAQEAADNGDEIEPIQRRVTCKNGDVRDVEFRITQLDGISVVTMLDLTERIRTENELARHRERLEELVVKRTAELEEKAAQVQLSDTRLQASLSFANIGAWDWDISTGDLFWSAQIAPLFGHEEGLLETSYENFIAAVHPSDREKVQQAVTDCVEGKSGYDIEHRVVWPDGTVHWVRERGGVTRDADGNPKNMLGVVQDISDQKQILMEQQYAQTMLEDQAKNLANIAQELEFARADAEDANKAKSAFLAVMSHEIRTPLNGIIGMVDMLKETILSLDQKHMIMTVRDSSLSLLTVINDILDFSKIESGKMELDATSVSPLEVVDSAAITFGSVAQKKSLDFFVYEDPALPDFINVDGDRLRQILLNLIGNAVKFTATNDEKTGRIVLYAGVEDAKPGKDQAQLVFKVIDNGIGISKEAQENLFKSFTQADGTITRRFGGTGLGLSICQSLVKMMGGQISVESELGKGATFTVRLPLKTTTETDRPVEHHDISGLRVALFSTNDEHGTFLKNYLDAASADVELLSDMNALVPLIEKSRKDNKPIDVVIVDDAWKPGTHVDAIWPIIGKITKSEVTVLLTRFDAHSLPEKFKGKCVALRDMPLGRMGFIRGVAIAAGLESPDALMTLELAFAEALPIPTVDEAEAVGELVLLAEDNLVNQDVLIRQLNLLGYAVVAAENGQEALDQFKQRTFGLVLSDLHMPVMDGYQLTEEIRKIDQANDEHTPIIAVTAAALSAELERCVEIGMDTHVTKPLVLTDLKAAMDKWLPHAEAPSAAPLTQPQAFPVANKGEEPPEITEAPVDPTMLVQMVGDDPELHAELIGEFLKTTEDILSEMDGYFTKRRLDKYGGLVHRIKSSARTVGANKMGDMCHRLEVSAKSSDWNTVEQLHPLLYPEFLLVKKFFIDTKRVEL